MYCIVKRATEKTIGAFGVQKFRACELREIQHLCYAFNLSRQQGVRLLNSLRVPIFYVGANAFFSQYTLEKVFYFMLKLGGSGFAAPGSDKKAKGRGQVPVTITDDFIEKCSSAEALVEIYLAGGKRDKAGDTLAEIIKKMKKEKPVIMPETNKVTT